MSVQWTVGNIIRKRADVSPDKAAVVFEGREITYKSLNEASNRVGRFLQLSGVRRGDRVAVLLDNCVEFIEIYFAVAKLGAILVPLNCRLVARELTYQLNDCAARALFFHDAFKETVNQIRVLCQVEDNKLFFVDSKLKNSICPEYAQDYFESKHLMSSNECVLDESVEIDDPLAIIYTSGTTGSPKGAVVSHEQTFYKNFQVAVYTEARPDDVIISGMPFFHSGGLFIVLTPAISNGMKVVLRSEFNPQEFAKDIEVYRGTVIFALTTMWKMILATNLLETVDTTSVRCVLGGGERTPQSMFEELSRYGLYMQQGFGQTENSAMMLMPKGDIFRKMGSIGKPGFFNDAWIAGKDGERLLPGQVGHIVASGPTVMSGYWNLPEATAETLVGKVLYTGDLGYMDEEGFFYIVDREKDMYRSGGENVYPAEIEKILLEHPAIGEVAIVGVPDEKWGQSGKAYIVAKKNQSISIEDVRQFLNGKVSRYKFPTSIELIKEMPRTATMKVKKSDLKKMQMRGDEVVNI